MAIKFFSIRTKEVRVAETEPQITALWASSDHSPNVSQGQDFGWRLAPEVVVQMKKIKQDPFTLERIAARTNRLIEDIKEPEILDYISSLTKPGEEAIANDMDYTDEYEQEIRRIEREDRDSAVPTTTPETVTTTTTESLADMRERAELAERIAKAKTAESAATTTTTTVVPTTTTTTTKSK